MRRAVLAGLAAAVALGVVPHAHACSCAREAKRFAAADAVFAGSVSVVDVPADWRAHTRATLVVDRVYKGDVPSPVVVETPRTEAACGVEFVPGATYTVFAEVRGRALVTGLCEGTVGGAGLLEDRPWREPLAFAAPGSPVTSRAGPVAAAAILLATGIAGAGLMLRQRASR